MTQTTAQAPPLGVRIREARERAGYSQDRLAAALNTTRQVIIGWEKGRHRPQERHRVRLIEVTGQKDLFDSADEEDE